MPRMQTIPKDIDHAKGIVAFFNKLSGGISKEFRGRHKKLKKDIENYNNYTELDKEINNLPNPKHLVVSDKFSIVERYEELKKTIEGPGSRKYYKKLEERINNYEKLNKDLKTHISNFGLEENEDGKLFDNNLKDLRNEVEKHKEKKKSIGYKFLRLFNIVSPSQYHENLEEKIKKYDNLKKKIKEHDVNEKVYDELKTKIKNYHESEVQLKKYNSLKKEIEKYPAKSSIPSLKDISNKQLVEMRRLMPKTFDKTFLPPPPPEKETTITQDLPTSVPKSVRKSLRPSTPTLKPLTITLGKTPVRPMSFHEAATQNVRDWEEKQAQEQDQKKSLEPTVASKLNEKEAKTLQKVREEYQKKIKAKLDVKEEAMDDTGHDIQSKPRWSGPDKPTESHKKKPYKVHRNPTDMEKTVKRFKKRRGTIER